MRKKNEGMLCKFVCTEGLHTKFLRHCMKIKTFRTNNVWADEQNWQISNEIIFLRAMCSETLFVDKSSWVPGLNTITGANKYFNNFNSYILKLYERNVYKFFIAVIMYLQINH